MAFGTTLPSRSTKPQHAFAARPCVSAIRLGKQNPPHNLLSPPSMIALFELNIPDSCLLAEVLNLTCAMTSATIVLRYVDPTARSH